MPKITCPQCGRTSHNRHDVEAGYCGNCHDWTSLRPDGYDPRMRFRMWVGGELRAEEWLTIDDPDADAKADAIRTQHMQLAVAAHLAGIPWLCEVWDPAGNLRSPITGQPGECMRFGTDRSGMHEPAELVLIDPERLN
jgi:hypothetical protein